MTYLCYHRFPSGRFCKRWAVEGTRFCHAHAQDNERLKKLMTRPMDTISSLSRLASRHDVFDVVREAINAARLGALTPGQAYAIGYLAEVWLRIDRGFNHDERQEALRRQYLREVLAEEAALLDDAEPASVPGSPRPTPHSESPQPASIQTPLPASTPHLEESPTAPVETSDSIPASSLPTSPEPTPVQSLTPDEPAVDVSGVLLDLIKKGAQRSQRPKRFQRTLRPLRPAPNGPG